MSIDLNVAEFDNNVYDNILVMEDVATLLYGKKGIVGPGGEYDPTMAPHLNTVFTNLGSLQDQSKMNFIFTIVNCVLLVIIMILCATSMKTKKR